jgi:hypothetical protein
MATMDPSKWQVPQKEIPRLRYPQDLSRESFERDFASKSEPVTGAIELGQFHQRGLVLNCGLHIFFAPKKMEK